MGIALTIGMMFLIFGFIGYMQDEGPSTFLDNMPSWMYIVIGVTVLIHCGIYFLLE